MINLEKDGPIYLQVINDIKVKIMSNTLRPGDKIQSVRELALELGVNPNTVQRAFLELEKEELIRTERAVGRYVTSDHKLIEESRERLIQKNIHVFVDYMASLGVEKKDICKYLEEDSYE